MRIVEFRPPRIAAGLLAAASLVHWLVPPPESLRVRVPTPGALCLLVGFLIMLWAWRLFRKDDVAVCPVEATARLVLRGPYRFTRNPMYLGMVLMVLGVALWVGTWPFWAAVLLFWGVLQGSFISFEERKLEAAFGEEFRRYRGRVRRWL